MKRITPLVILLVFIGFSMPVYAKGFKWKPREVVVVNQDPIPVTMGDSQEYEYKVIRLERGDVTDALTDFQDALNSDASEGWELVSFSYWETAPTVQYVYVGILRRPM